MHLPWTSGSAFSWKSVAAIEPKFFHELLKLLQIDPKEFPAQTDKARAGEARDILSRRFRTRPRDEWCAIFEGSDACVAPVLSMVEAPQHPHMKARTAFVEIAGVTQPAPVR